MIERILVATDGSTLGDKAVGQAIQLAGDIGVPMHVVVVQTPAVEFIPSQPDGRYPERLFEELRDIRSKEFKAILEAAIARGTNAGVEAIAMPVEHKQAYTGILDAATACKASFIVMGSTGRTEDRFPLGSQAMKVIALSNIPVHLVK